MGNDLGMQYIMDGNGNYYTVNSSDQLVVAKDRNEAAVFTLFEANQRIGGGKKSKFYQAIPVGDLEETEHELLADERELVDALDTSDASKIFSIVEEINISEPKEEMKPREISKPQPAFEYSMDSIDWNEFINYFIFVSSGAKGYQEEFYCDG